MICLVGFETKAGAYAGRTLEGFSANGTSGWQRCHTEAFCIMEYLAV